MDTLLNKRCKELELAIERFALISAHDALLILKNSLGASKMLYTIRSSPSAGHPALIQFDILQRQALTTIANTDVTDLGWIQASLPVRSGGLGIRSVEMLAPSAFLASAAATSETQASLLPSGFNFPDVHVSAVQSIWQSKHPQAVPPTDDAAKQRSWDAPLIQLGVDILLTTASTDQHHSARLLACMAPHSGDWLQAWPISSCGLRLDNETIRVAVGLRLGANLCIPHTCPCGALVDARGTHGLACRRSQGRSVRHGLLNDMVFRALTRAQIPSCKEPLGLLLSNGKRPDGETKRPWRRGKCLAWDVTVPDTLASSHLPFTSKKSGAAAESADNKKTIKYAALTQSHEFCTIACETMGPINENGLNFIKELGRQMTIVTGDTRETSFFLQRLSILIQRSNAIAFSGTFCDVLNDYS